MLKLLHDRCTLREFLRQPLVIFEEAVLVVQLVAFVVMLRAAVAFAQPYDPTYSGGYQPNVLGMPPVYAFIIAMASIVFPGIISVVLQIIQLRASQEAARNAAESTAKTEEGNLKIDRLRDAVNGQTDRLVNEASRRGRAEGFTEGGEHVRAKQAEHAEGLAAGRPVALTVPVVLAPGAEKPKD